MEAYVRSLVAVNKYIVKLLFCINPCRTYRPSLAKNICKSLSEPCNFRIGESFNEKGFALVKLFGSIDDVIIFRTSPTTSVKLTLSFFEIQFLDAERGTS